MKIPPSLCIKRFCKFYAAFIMDVTRYEYSIGEKGKTHKKKFGTIKHFIVPEISFAHLSTRKIDGML